MEYIIRQFFADQAIFSFAPFGNGHINDTYRFEVEGNGHWLLQRLNHHVFQRPDAVMHNIRLVAAHLAA